MLIGMNTINDVVVGIIQLAKKIAESSNSTTHSLLKETGYFDIHAQISVAAIQAELRLHPSCISDWVQFSEDKRTTDGWYLKQDGANYEVGFCSLSKKDTLPEKYTDKIEACAAFIKHEIEAIRNS